MPPNKAVVLRGGVHRVPGQVEVGLVERTRGIALGTISNIDSPVRSRRCAPTSYGRINLRLHPWWADRRPTARGRIRWEGMT